MHLKTQAETRSAFQMCGYLRTYRCQKRRVSPWEEKVSELLVSVLALPLLYKGFWLEGIWEYPMTKLNLLPSHLSSARGPSDRAGMPRLLPAPNVIHQPFRRPACSPRKVWAKQEEGEVNELIITGASCNVIGEALRFRKTPGRFSLVYYFKN